MSTKRRICEKFEREEIIKDENEWTTVKIPFAEEKYDHILVSKTGLIWNSKSKTLLKQPDNNFCYKQVCLHSKFKEDKEQIVKNVGFIVLVSFDYDGYMDLVNKYGFEQTRKGQPFAIDVSHIDSCKFNNNLSNLCWKLHKDNIMEPHRLRIMGERMRKQWSDKNWSKEQGRRISEGLKKYHQKKKEEKEKSEVN